MYGIGNIVNKTATALHDDRCLLNISWWSICIVYKCQITMLYCFCSVDKLCPTLCDPMNCSTPGSLSTNSEFAQTHVHWVGDAIQPSHSLSPSSPSALNLKLIQYCMSTKHQLKIFLMKKYLWDTKSLLCHCVAMAILLHYLLIIGGSQSWTPCDEWQDNETVDLEQWILGYNH